MSETAESHSLEVEEILESERDKALLDTTATGQLDLGTPIQDAGIHSSEMLGILESEKDKSSTEESPMGQFGLQTLIEGADRHFSEVNKWLPETPTKWTEQVKPLKSTPEMKAFPEVFL